MHPSHPPDSPLRFLHIHTFYPNFLVQFHEKNPRIKEKPFAEQNQALLDSGFSAAHIFTPYLPKLGYDPTFLVANNAPSQLKWLQEQSIKLQPTDLTINHVTKLQIEYYKPDILYFGDTIQFDSTFLRSLRHKPRLVMGWRGAEVTDRTDWSEYDVILSGLPKLLDVAKKLGAKETAFFFPGYPEHVNSNLQDIEPRFDVVFAGSCVPKQHQTRNNLLANIARHAVNSSQSYSCAFFLNGKLDTLAPEVLRYNQPPVFGLDMHRAIKKGRIVFDARADHYFYQNGKNIDIGGVDTVNMRLFEATGAGCFLLTQYFENLDQYFEPGKELETFTTPTELVEKIQYYLAHPKERHRIAQQGQEKCMRSYNMHEQAKKFDAIIRRHLSQKATSPQKQAQVETPPPSHSEMSTPAAASDSHKVEHLLRNAIKTFKSGQYAVALQQASQAKTFKLPCS